MNRIIITLSNCLATAVLFNNSTEADICSKLNNSGKCDR